jgi:NhaA family Na+:H+ antiporter
LTPDPSPAAPRVGIVEFLRSEAAGGLLLALAAAVSLIWANSRAAGLYHALLELPISVSAGDLRLAKPLLLWINDGLMAVFFLLVGLEIKREVFAGELSSRERIVLPGAAALGGMIVPALVYTAFNFTDPETIHGWAIPTATDIAFALGVAALLGDRIPPGLKLLLMALAVIDDLGAIVIIAVFYTSEISALSLELAGVGVLVLIVLNRAHVSRLTPYILVGVFIWVCVLKSGVHATLAGVVLAFAIPIKARDGAEPLHHLEGALNGFVSYGILPMFALANAGVSLHGVAWRSMLDPIPLGVALGLLLGKPVGVMLAGLAAVRLRIAMLPTGVDWRQYFGMSLLTGIGFTMSLFLGTLAFESSLYQTEVRLGVLTGSVIAAIAGFASLRASRRAPV